MFSRFRVWVPALLAGLALDAFSARPHGSYGLYEKAEETVSWERHGLANPFADAELRLTITAPQGRLPADRFDFHGFFDGDGKGGQAGSVWKFRILLDKPGKWTVKARFVDPATGKPKASAPGEKTFAYTVDTVPLPGEHGHIRVDVRHPMRLAHADGKPWVPFPVHASMLLEQSPANAREWMDAHAALGVNSLAVRFHSEIQEGMTGVPAQFHYLLLNGRRASSWPGTTAAFDYARFDVASWTRNEAVLEYARSKGIKLSIWFGISGMNAQYSSYGPAEPASGQGPPGPGVGGPGPGRLQKLFIRYFLARWAADANWWHWTIDSEYEETGEGALARNRAYAAEMRALNPWRTLLTTHVVADWTPGDAPEFDIATLQARVIDSDKGAVESGRFITRNLKYGKPVYNAEGVWNLSDPARVRTATLAHLMAGGYSHAAYDADDPRRSSWGASWSSVDTIHRRMAAEVGRISRFFNEGPGGDVNLAVPRPEWVSESRGRPVFCLAAPPRTYYVWLPEGGRASLDLGAALGTFRVTRYAGMDASRPEPLASVKGGGTVSLGATPAEGFGKDYFLVVEGAGRTRATASLSAARAAPAGEGRPPVLTGIGLANTGDSLAVTWSTDEPASSRVQWGAAAGNYPGESGVVRTGVTAHKVRIPRTLPADSRVFLLLISSDSLGNTAILDTMLRIPKAAR